MQHYDDRMLRAYEVTLNDYRNAIRELQGGFDVEGIQERWRLYGGIANCRMCRASVAQSAGIHAFSCQNCAINPGGRIKETNGCACAEKTQQDLYKALRGTGVSRKKLLKAFIKRYLWLIKTATRNGVLGE